MKWFIPREHGAWAMLIVPYLLGMFTSNVTWLHFVFFTGVMAFYVSSGPLFAIIRQPKLKREALPPFFICLSIGLIFTIPILYLMPNIIYIGLLIIPFFTLNIIFAKLKKERLFINDLVAIIALSFLVLAAYFIGSGVIDLKALVLMLINVIFFTASVFHVKTLIREFGNKSFAFSSNVFHGVIVAAFFIFSMPIVALVFLISTLKSWFVPKKRYKPIQIGLVEIANSVIFVAIIGIFY
ncbi:YwiC-like family protein [Bacillaceae bacterium IKA-2]|nr:YwiC-like family protein [Bacillaceae bacterium IKA-2]